VTDAAAHDGARLREGLVDRNNTASDVWANSTYRSAVNEAFRETIGKRNQIHLRKPKSKAMPQNMARANGRKSKIRSKVKHVFAHQKQRIDMVIRTMRLERAKTKIGLVNLAYNMHRIVTLNSRIAPA